METTGVSLDEIARGVLSLMERPVINRTGIEGRFDLRLEFAPDESTPGMRLPPSDDPPGAPSVFQAIQQQLGLKLEPARGPGEFLVIDHIERPSEN